MGQVKAYMAAEWISVANTNNEYKPVRDVLVQVLTEKLSKKSPEDIAETAESLLIEDVSELKNISAINLDDGIESTYKIDGDETEAYIMVFDHPALKRLNQLLTLTPDQFEIFCKDILKKLGATAERIGGGK